MKVAVTSQGLSLSSPVGPRFGHAKHFIIVDTDSGDLEVVHNEQDLDAALGVWAGQKMASKNVGVLISGHCGPHAFLTLSAAGIKVVSGAEGTVSEALEKFKAGELKESDGADVEGHWV